VAKRIQAIRGMNDVVPEQTVHWQFIERILSQCLSSYGYQEIRFPLLENTQLFKRTIGDITDIVEKEMYTFADLNDDSITLRPEGTAGCVRACLEHGLLHNQQQKLWYMGPMFRHERPQKGRYRQFTQFGVEALGIPGVAIELELIAINHRLWQQLGFSDCVQLQVNTLGELSERNQYKEILVEYFKAHYSSLDKDSQTRLEKNPLRILDSKNPEMEPVIKNAPKLTDVLSPASKQHFKALCHGLEALGIPFVVNPFLVRGLDYYGHTVFEWVTRHLGSQATICAGGRYDILVEQLGGQATPAVGFALGIERIFLLMETLSALKPTEIKPSIFIIADSELTIISALQLAERIRNQYPDITVMTHTAGGSFKSQFKKADKSGARFALILGASELQQDKVTFKDLRKESEQQTISMDTLGELLKSIFNNNEVNKENSFQSDLIKKVERAIR
jgi:histidyl-tRNA synthetase